MIHNLHSLEQARAVGSVFSGGDVTWKDNKKALFGDAGDTSISYDGTNMLVNPAVVGSGEFRVGGTTNYCAIQADGDLKFAGTAQLRVANNTAAFVSDSFPSAGLFFVTTFGGAYQFTDASGNQCAAIPIDQAAVFDFGVAYTEISPTQITSNQNDYAGTAQNGYARISSDTARNITGIAAPSDGQGGRILLITNVGTQTITFTHLDTNSLAANRIIGIGAANTNLTGGQNMGLIYDTTTNRWRIMYVQ